MTDRRRNLFILLVVAGLIIASAVAIVSRETKLGLDLEGGVELVYEARPTPQQPVVDEESLDRAIEVMRDRVDRLGVAEPEIQRSGSDQISVALPGADDVERAVEQVGKVAQLFFYDWEKNVIGPDGEPAPDDPDVTGGQAAGQLPSALGHYEAVIRAKGVEAERDEDNTHDGLFYLVDREQREVLAGPEPDRAELFPDGEPPEQLPANQQVYEVPPGVVLVRAEASPDTDQAPDRWYVLRDDPALQGTDITEPEQRFDDGAGGTGQPIVTFDFTDEGQRQWEQVTREIAQRGQNQLFGSNADAAAQHFAIVLDNELISVPRIDPVQNPDGISGSNGSQIEGGFTIETAQELANFLKTGALPLQLELISQSQVSATLGKQALNQGLIAGLVGFAVVVLFLLALYRVLGVIAVSALLLYAVFLYALIKLIPVTLTLPGIAGLILTIGVAADANIVIFERVKEEVRAGRSVMAGIAAGYKKGLTAIVDANIVTIMVAFILFVLATAGVKGFALVLGVGTIVSFFTAVLFTQAILGTMGRSRALARPSALGAAKQKRRIGFDFMGAARWFFSMSGLILLVGALAIGGKGITFGIDFESGTRIKTALTQPADVNDVRSVLAAEGYADATIQEIEEPELGENAFQISTPTLQPEDVAGVRGALDDRFGVGEDAFQNTSIGPTFGETVARSAIIAIIASLLVIAAYIALRFQPKYAVPVLIGVMHDILITAGVYSLTGREVTSATVAAILTIIGYSLYDTIIVFDRIRENVPRMPRAAFSQVVNRSMSEVIVRSLATTFSTLLPVVCLYFFGGETLKDFAFALIVGILSGTYSSIFVASPVLTLWKEREPVYARRRARIAEEFGGVVPAYAVSTPGGSAVDEEPISEKDRIRERRRLTAPDDRAVSGKEFEKLVRDIEHETRRSSAATAEREAEGEGARDLDPSEVTMPKRDKNKQRRPRNRRHGRNR